MSEIELCQLYYFLSTNEYSCANFQKFISINENSRTI